MNLDFRKAILLKTRVSEILAGRMPFEFNENRKAIIEYIAVLESIVVETPALQGDECVAVQQVQPEAVQTPAPKKRVIKSARFNGLAPGQVAAVRAIQKYDAKYRQHPSKRGHGFEITTFQIKNEMFRKMKGKEFQSSKKVSKGIYEFVKIKRKSDVELINLRGYKINFRRAYKSLYMQHYNALPLSARVPRKPKQNKLWN